MRNRGIHFGWISEQVEISLDARVSSSSLMLFTGLDLVSGVVVVVTGCLRHCDGRFGEVKDLAVAVWKWRCRLRCMMTVSFRFVERESC